MEESMKKINEDLNNKITVEEILNSCSLKPAMKRNENLTEFQKLMISIVIKKEAFITIYDQTLNILIKEMKKTYSCSVENIILNGDKDHTATQEDPSKAEPENWYIHDQRLAFNGLNKVGYRPLSDLGNKTYLPVSNLKNIETPLIKTNLLQDADLILIPSDAIEYNFKNNIEIKRSKENEDFFIVIIYVSFNVKEGPIKVK